MKKFKKDYMLALRVNGLMMDQVDDLAEFMEMDRADWLRMVIWNGIKYYAKIKEDKDYVKMMKVQFEKDKAL